MRAWFASLERRERMILSIGAALAVVIVLWGLVWRPLSSGAAELDSTVAEKQLLLATLQRAAALSTAAGDGAAGPSGTEQSLVVLVDQTHREHGLTGMLSRNQPDGPDGIRVTFQAAPFDSLVSWLVTLQNHYGVAVESANFDGGRQSGLVGATLVLRRG